MLLFALHHSKCEQPIAYFSAELYPVFSDFMYSLFTGNPTLSKGLSLTICCPPDNILRVRFLEEDYNGIIDSDGNLIGVIDCHWLVHIIPFIYKPSKFNLL